MKKSILSLCFVVCSISSFCQTKNELKKKIDNYIKEVIEINQIPRLAVAVIKKEKIIYEKYYGKGSIEENTNVNTKSIFRLYSTTKLISAIAVFPLIERNQITLEDKISKYLDNLPKEWQDVKIKNLLTHSSGLPDIVKFEDIQYSLDDGEKWKRLY